MIKELFLKDFRGIKAGKLENFSQFNILLGPNNSGKSTILESLYLLFSTTPADVFSERFSFSGSIPHKDFSGHDPLIRLQRKHGISKWEGNPASFDEGIIRVKTKKGFFDISNREKAFEREDIDKIGYISFDYSKKALKSDKQQGEMEYLKLMITEEEIEDNFPDEGRVGVLWVQDFTYEAAGAAVWAASVEQATPHNVLFFDLFTAMKHIRTAFYKHTLLSLAGWLDEIKERFGTIFPNGDFQVNFLPTENDLVRGSLAYRGKIAIPVDLLGDGARSIFKFLCYLTALDENGLVLWEDPELFQYSETLERSLTELVAIAKQKNLQVFFCTQSLEILGWFAEMVKKDVLSSEDVRAYYLDLKEGILSHASFTGSSLLTWLEVESDPRKMHRPKGKVIYRMMEE